MAHKPSRAQAEAEPSHRVLQCACQCSYLHRTLTFTRGRQNPFPSTLREPTVTRPSTLCACTHCSRTASLMMCHMSGKSWLHSRAKLLSPGRGAPNVYTCGAGTGF